MLEGGPVPAKFAASRTVFIPMFSDANNNGRIVRSLEAPRPLTLCNFDCKILPRQWQTMRCIHPSQRWISSRQMTDNIFEVEATRIQGPYHQYPQVPTVSLVPCPTLLNTVPKLTLSRRATNQDNAHQSRTRSVQSSPNRTRLCSQSQRTEVQLVSPTQSL